MKRAPKFLSILLIIVASGAFGRSGDPILSERDRAKVAQVVADYFAARRAADYRGMSKAYAALQKELEAKAKRAKVDTLLMSPADLRDIFSAPIEKPPRFRKGYVGRFSGSEMLRSGVHDYSYLLRIPKGYKDSDAYPLVMFLHAEGLDSEALEDRIDRLYPGDLVESIIVLAPDKTAADYDWMSLEGRMTAFFSLLQVQARFSMDRLRVFVDGEREGALAAVQYAQSYPGTFTGVVLRELTVAPPELALSNAQHIPFLLLSPKNGDSATLMSQFADTAKAHKIEAVELVPTDLGADGSPGAEGASALTRFVTETRKKVAPERVEFTTTTPEIVNAYWLHLTQFDATEEEPVTVTGEIDRATNQITVSTPPAVSAFIVYVNDDLVDMGETIKVVHRVSGEEESGEPKVVFEGTRDRNLDRTLTLWFNNQSGNLGEVYTNMIEVELPRQ